MRLFQRDFAAAMLAPLMRSLAPLQVRRSDAGGRPIAPAISYACAIALGLAIASACARPRALSAVDRGAVIYRTNCSSCHNADPNLPGPIGPAIAGASRALLDARVLHGTYPPGYVPRLRTHTMRALPWLDGHVDDLAAFLAAASARHPS